MPQEWPKKRQKDKKQTNKKKLEEWMSSPFGEKIGRECRWRKAKKQGLRTEPSRNFNISR